jgi:antitoxin component YwqK of YwqJK toxin-antitoxin module
VKIVLLIGVAVLLQHSSSSQTKAVDTIKFYTGITLSSGPDGCFLNGTKIPRFRYEYYKKNFDQINQCTPCWTQNYTLDDILVSEGLFYTDCPVGKITFYHETGSVKLTGNYSLNTDGNWTNWYNRGGCRKQGEWVYFDENGKMIKKEFYKDGIIVPGR